MGNLQATEFANRTDEGTGLRWHLQHNHFPPVHPDFIESAKTALDHAEAEEWDHEIELPNGKVLTVSRIIEGLHLGPFLDARLAPDPEDEDFFDELNEFEEAEDED